MFECIRNHALCVTSTACGKLDSHLRTHAKQCTASSYADHAVRLLRLVEMYPMSIDTPRTHCKR